ncbi:MAG: lipoprotein insertase outer membrane protein LolB [Dokdonella sp.]
MIGWIRPALLVCILLALAACAPQRLRPDASGLDAQARREAVLSSMTDWGLVGRLGVSDGRDSGSGSLTWSQNGGRYRFELNAPVTGKTWLLTGDASHAELQGLREKTVTGRDAASLLQRELSWRVPVAELAWWARGLRAPGEDAQLSVRGDGLPARIIQGGWQVDFLDYDETTQPPLPRKLFAESGKYKVRLVIQRWEKP